MRHACIFGVLLATLSGCNGSSGSDSADSTFEVPAPGPVVGTVTLEDNSGKSVPDSGTKLPVAERCDPVSIQSSKPARFTEIAPDTIACPKFTSSPTYKYDLGNLVAVASDDSRTFSRGTTFITPVRGWVRYPEKALTKSAAQNKYPIVIFMHGNHVAKNPSYKGYDYLAADLAAHGYLVLSIDANAMNAYGDPRAGGDQSSHGRAQLILGTLDRLREIDERGQTEKDGEPGALDSLVGKLDFERIGIMGHSRGGQGVANAINFNTTRRGATKELLTAAVLAAPKAFESAYPDLVKAVTEPYQPSTLEGIFGTGQPVLPDQKLTAALSKYNIFLAAGSGGTTPYYSFKGAFMLAPTDFAGVTGLNHVPLANLLPSCDGDVSNLQGAYTFDHNRFGPEDDVAPRYQILVRGANHNFYNTVWAGPDSHNAYCRNKDIYLSPVDQRRGGLFILNSFMRYHVGGEQQFAAYWNGTAQLPEKACPSGKGTCDERVVLSIQKGAKQSKLIQRFEQSESMKTNLLGGSVKFSGFDERGVGRCSMGIGTSLRGTCEVDSGWMDGFENVLSRADQAQLVWSDPNPEIINDLAGISAVGYDSLTFRIAVVEPIGQEVKVTLTDSAGQAATVTASDFTDALYNAPRTKADGRPLEDDPSDPTHTRSEPIKLLLNMVAIPLKAFEGVDLTNLKELKLSFPKEFGSVAITDIEFQNLGRE